MHVAFAALLSLQSWQSLSFAQLSRMSMWWSLWALASSWPSSSAMDSELWVSISSLLPLGSSGLSWCKAGSTLSRMGRSSLEWRSKEELGSRMAPLAWPVEELEWEPSSWQHLSLSYVKYKSASKLLFSLHMLPLAFHLLVQRYLLPLWWYCSKGNLRWVASLSAEPGTKDVSAENMYHPHYLNSVGV